MKFIPHSLLPALVCFASLFFVWTLARPSSAAKATTAVSYSAQVSSTRYAMD
jgi:hypothetical protein